MKTSIATVSLSGDLAEKLQAIAAAGFDGVEIFENDFLAFHGGPREVGRMASDLGLEIVAFQPFRDFEGLPEPERERAFTRAERKFDIMEELGATLLLVCSNVSPAAQGGIDRAAADFHELGERAAARGLRIGYEALAWGRHVNDYRDAWEIIRRADHPVAGLVLDSFHTLARDLPVDPIRAIPGDRIVLVQLADAPRLAMDPLSWSRHFRCFPGQGDLPVEAFAEAVAATGYAGPLSLEIFNDQFRAGASRRMAVDGLRSLIRLAGRVPALDPGGPVLPPPARCLAVEFVEFAVDEETADALADLFAGMGFAHCGTHRSKAVTRWAQGDINLVINTEKEGFAHSHQIVHGPGVCAIGLRVGDTATAFERAKELKAQTFSQPVGPDELNIPAIRGVGGSLLYFTEPKGALGAVWEHEFTALRPVADGHLQAIDHISQSMHYDEMLSWLLFYTSIFDLRPAPQLDIADPGGLVQSQALLTEDGSIRIVLNGSQATRTLSSRFLSEFFGSGVQHIAFSTGDIFAAVAAMRGNGVALLDIPDNYYDDLAARYDLDQALLDRLRENHVLYDRDGDAEYFQVYTALFADRFFFEIVERRDYEGFGAINAPVRLAAQSRAAPPSGMPLV